jgi:hypothetical protein
MKALVALLILLPLVARAAPPQESRVMFVRHDPITNSFTPQPYPREYLENGQRYRVIITELQLDGSLKANQYIDFTYAGPTHPSLGFNLFGSDNNVKDQVPSPANLVPVKVFGAGKEGLPSIVNDQDWFSGKDLGQNPLCGDRYHHGPCKGGGDGLGGGAGDSQGKAADGTARYNPDLKMEDLPENEPPQSNPRKSMKPSTNADSQTSPAPSAPSESNLGKDLADVGRQAAMNVVLEGLKAFRETPEDRRLREDFEHRQNEIFEKQRRLEQQLIDHKVESARSVAEALSTFQDITQRPTVEEVKHRIEWARNHGDPEAFEKILNTPYNEAMTDLTSYLGEDGHDIRDFVTTVFPQASHVENMCIIATGKDSTGQPASTGKRLGLLVKYTGYVLDGTIVAGVAAKYGAIEKVVSFSRWATAGTAGVLADNPATLVAVAVYSQQLNANEFGQYKSLDAIAEPTLKNVAGIFYNHHDMGNDNLANNVLGETYAAWSNPRVQLKDTALARDMSEYLNNWIAKNQNAATIDMNVAKEIRNKLKLSLEFKLPETNHE